MILAKRKPRSAGGKPGEGRTVPWHWAPFRVASKADSRFILLRRILYKVWRNGHVRHPNLFTVVQRDRSWKRAASQPVLPDDCRLASRCVCCRDFQGPSSARHQPEAHCCTRKSPVLEPLRSTRSEAAEN